MMASAQLQNQWHGLRRRTRQALARAGEQPAPEQLLGIYLNDHLAGATSGTELARRMASTGQQTGDRATLRGLARNIDRDRQDLLSIMAALRVPVRRYKTSAAWMAEKAGRLKLNGALLTRSPLSSLEELEILRLGVEGKAAGWRTLREIAETDRRLQAAQLDALIGRAREQADLLEELRVGAVRRIFGIVD